MPATPLAEAHRAAGATFTDFAGWQMPLRYTSDLAEHTAVRERAGLFDLSHMGEIAVDGPDAGALLDRALSSKLSTIAVGRAKYTLLLDPDGGVLDDLIVYRLDQNFYLVVANAANRETVARELAVRGAESDATVEDVSADWALIALQGPAAETVLRDLLAADPEALEAVTGLRPYRAVRTRCAGAQLLAARTGYTGEDGFELYLAPEAAAAVWDALLAAGQAHGIAPCGLAARDSLRLEAGMPLYGHELTREILPVQAGLDRVAPHETDRDFVGRDALRARAGEELPVLVGLASEGRRAGRAGYPVTTGEDDEQPEGPIGRVTSGALSPTLGHPIAMAYVEPRYAAPGTVVTIEVRGKPLPARVVDLPFRTRPAR